MQQQPKGGGMSYERSSRRRQPAPHSSTLGHWVPLVFTITVATIGLAAWVWSERRDDDGRDDDDNKNDDDKVHDYHVDDYVPPPNTNLPPATFNPSVPYDPNNPAAQYPGGPAADGSQNVGPTTGYEAPTARPEGDGYMARMSGALRSVSPQQFFDGAHKTVVAGVAAAGAVVGNALGSIREEDKDAFQDHETWSEEGPAGRASAGAQRDVSTGAHKDGAKDKRRVIAVVVSADSDVGGLDDDEDMMHEHASILSHIPRTIDHSKINLFVLIYAPNLKEHPLESASATRPPGSLSSSFSNIGYDQAYTPTGEVEKQLDSSSASSSTYFASLYATASQLVASPTHILPFTTATGHVHMLRHLQPALVYLQESLSGPGGGVITHLQTWLRHDVVLVVGAESGHGGGLADSESEMEPENGGGQGHGQAQAQAQGGDGRRGAREQKWWEREDRVGLGRGVVVVEGARVADDWARRIEGKE